MNKSSKLAILALAAATLCNGQAVAEQQVSESNGISLTIYNQDLGLVKDVRTIDLKQGLNDVRFEDVAARIDPTSVSFQSLTAPNSVIVREQNYQYDLLNTNTILSKSIGKQATFRQILNNGQVNQITGILLNAPQVSVSDSNGYSSTVSQGLVIKTGDSLILDPEGQIEIASLPPGLVSKPSLLWKIETDKPGKHNTEIAYQTQGLNWHADYVAVANEDDTKVDLTGWVTIDNKSGTSYRDASLKLVAGNVHRVTQPTHNRGVSLMSAGSASMSSFQEQEFSEYHLYALKGKTNVGQNEIKQISLLNAANVQATKLLAVDNKQPYYSVANNIFNTVPVQLKLEIKNTAANNLGMPLPQGKVRVYKRDKDGALQFVGEDSIRHTPRDEKILLQLGESFDVVCERKQIEFIQVSPKVIRSTESIVLRNHKNVAVTVSVIEPAYGQWKILSASQSYEKMDSHRIEFKVQVPANGEAKVTYQIEIKS